MKWNELHNQIEKLIRNQQDTEARYLLHQVEKEKLPRESIARFANQARRIQENELALKWLNPIVRQDKGVLAPATVIEKSEYAAALTNIGAVFEAKDLLRTIKSESCPQALLYYAFACFTEWDYESAASSLEKYLKSEILNGYETLVGKINLAAAYIRIRKLEAASTLLNELRNETSSSFPRLYLNALELSTQVATFSNAFDKVDEYLGLAKKYIKPNTLDSLLVRKWMSVSKVFSKRRDAGAIEELRQIKKEALKIHQWETVRECDKYLSVALQDKELFKKVYFGTPYKSYRERLIMDFYTEVQLPFAYQYSFGGEKSCKKVLKLSELTLNGEVTELKHGAAIHRLLQVVSSDFYKPFRIGNLHAAIHPGEFFNPHSSPGKVHQIILRLREWFQENDFEMNLLEHGSYYTLHGFGASQIELTRQESRRHPLIRVLFDAFKDSPFSSTQASKFLNMPIRTTVRFLNQSVEEGILKKEGKSKNCRYTIKRSQSQSSLVAA